LRKLSGAFSVAQALEAVGETFNSSTSHHGLTHLAGLAQADQQALSFLSDRRYLSEAQASRAGAILVSDSLRAALPASVSERLVTVANPYLSFARISQWIAVQLEAQRESQEGRDLAPRPFGVGAWVHPSARLGQGVQLAPGVVIGAGTVIEDRVRLSAHCVVGRDCTIGADSLLYPHVVIYDDCQLGARAVVHSGTVIGGDGFGFARAQEQWVKIAQLGAVRIAADVEIGSNCSVDRGTLEDTVIEQGCKLDNLIQIAHNVRIGARTVIAACVGIAGSARIGSDCMIGGSVGILGHLDVVDKVTITPMSLVMSGLDKPGVYSGSSPLQAHRDWEKSAALLRNLPDLRSRLRALEALSKKTDQP
jgi:UDP-3-O-[3-hydroxymyristoyl] glucosamine N-acyltransferase